MLGEKKKKKPPSTVKTICPNLEGHSDYLYTLILVLVIFVVFVLLAERPEAVTGKYPFLGAVVLVNQIRQKIAYFNYVPIFKSTQMIHPFR